MKVFVGRMRCVRKQVCENDVAQNNLQTFSAPGRKRLSAPETTSHGTHVFCRDEGFWIHRIDDFSDAINVFA